MARDYIPRSDNDFLAWVQTFRAGLTDHAAGVGLEVTTDLGPLTTAVTDFSNQLTNHVAQQQLAQGVRHAKDAARDGLEQIVRGLVRRAQAHPGMTDSLRAELGITVPDATPTPGGGATALPVRRPVGMVDTSQRLRHEIRFVDEITPTRRAKPDGAMGCEIWVKIGNQGDPAPTDESQCQFLALDTASPYVAEYDGSHAGKTAHYLLRWVWSGGRKGSWSETVAVTIVG